MPGFAMLMGSAFFSLTLIVIDSSWLKLQILLYNPQTNDKFRLYAMISWEIFTDSHKQKEIALLRESSMSHLRKTCSALVGVVGLVTAGCMSYHFFSNSILVLANLYCKWIFNSFRDTTITICIYIQVYTVNQFKTWIESTQELNTRANFTLGLSCFVHIAVHILLYLCEYFWFEVHGCLVLHNLKEGEEEGGKT